MRAKTLTLIFCVLVFAAACWAQDPPSSAALTVAHPYLLGPGDEVSVTVLGEPDFGFVSVVNGDGNIEGPYFDKPIPAKCRSDREVRDDVIKELKKQLRSPMVNFRITQQRSRPPATVYGEVKTPTQFDLHRRVTLVELLAQAGGPTEDANGIVQVIRTTAPVCASDAEDTTWAEKDPDGAPQRIYSLSMVKQGDPKANPMIYPGDVIIVQRALPVYITGEVVQPQGIYIKENGLTLSEAIAKIGGIRREAKTKDIKIYRLKSGSKDREVISVNYDEIRAEKQKDPVLEPYDIVEVDKTKDSMAKTILQFAVGAGKNFVISGTSQLGYRVIY